MIIPYVKKREPNLIAKDQFVVQRSIARKSWMIKFLFTLNTLKVIFVLSFKGVSWFLDFSCVLVRESFMEIKQVILGAKTKGARNS